METISQAEKARIEKYVGNLVAEKETNLCQLLSNACEEGREATGKKFQPQYNKLSKEIEDAKIKRAKFLEKYNLNEKYGCFSNERVHQIQAGDFSDIRTKKLETRLESLKVYHKKFIESLIFKDMPEILRAINVLEDI